MPQADRITGIFKKLGAAPSPVAYVSVVHKGKESGRQIALLDTGADCTFMSMKAATLMLGMPQSEIENQKPDDATPVGGNKVKAYSFKRDIRLWHAIAGGDFIAISNAHICVLPELIKGFSVLVGQLDGLEEKVFRHSNRKANQVWELWTP